MALIELDDLHFAYPGHAPVLTGASLRLGLGWGDLCVMGGTIQQSHTHGVPKVAQAGPRLVVDGIYMNVSGKPYYLPMEILNRLHYPLSKGGQYYRAIPIASLGLAVMLAAGLSRFRRGNKAPYAVGFAWLLAAVAFGDAVRTTGPYWPRPVERVAGWQQYAAMSEAPEDGAVLALPIISTPSGVSA